MAQLRDGTLRLILTKKDKKPLANSRPFPEILNTVLIEILDDKIDFV